MANELIHYFNGNYVPKNKIKLSIDDVGILRGYGVFEFMQAQGSVPVFVEDHLGRLKNSASAMNMPLPFGDQGFLEIIHSLLNKNQLEKSSIKLIITGGNSADGFTPGKPSVIIMNNELQVPPESDYTNGISLLTYNYTRDYPEVKSTYYAKALALQRVWQRDSHTDVLYHDGEFISEVSRSNVFLFKKGKLITNETGVLNGVTRRNVIRCASQFMEVELRPIKLQELYDAEEVFMTSSTKKVMPVVKLEDQEIANGVVGELTKKMMVDFEAFRQAYIKDKTSS